MSGHFVSSKRNSNPKYLNQKLFIIGLFVSLFFKRKKNISRSLPLDFPHVLVNRIGSHAHCSTSCWYRNATTVFDLTPRHTLSGKGTNSPEAHGHLIAEQNQDAIISKEECGEWLFSKQLSVADSLHLA